MKYPLRRYKEESKVICWEENKIGPLSEARLRELDRDRDITFAIAFRPERVALRILGVEVQSFPHLPFVYERQKKYCL